MDRRELLLAAAAAPLSLGLASKGFARPNGGFPLVFVTADLDAHVAVVDSGTARVLSRIPTLAWPRSIETVGTTALVAHTELGRLSLVDAGTLRVRSVVGGLGAPRYTAARGSLAYVTDSARGELVTVDVRAGSIVSRVRVPGPARHLTTTPDGRAIWAALGSTARQIAVLDARRPRRPRLVRTLTPPFLAHDVVAAPDGEHVWVTSGDARRIAVFGRASRRPLELIDAHAPPQHVAFVGDMAVVASGDDGTLRVHRLDGTLLHEERVPVGSYNVSFGGSRVVTPSLTRGTVALLDARGRVRAVRRIARAAHDACVVTAT